jgi:hypothetical protein
LIVHLNNAGHFDRDGQPERNGLVNQRTLISLSLNLDGNCSAAGADPSVTPSTVNDCPAVRLAIRGLPRHRVDAGRFQDISLKRRNS